MLAQVASVVSPSAATREQFAVISFSILKQLHHCCSRSEIIVYNALALHADPSGHCWPGRARLAMLTNLSETRVSKATTGLERKGLLRKEPAANGRVDYWLLPVSEPTPPRDQNGTPPVTKTAHRTNQCLTDQKTERAAPPEPEPPPKPEPPPEPVRPTLSDCRLQTRTPLPEDWALPPDWHEWAIGQRPDLQANLDAIAENFGDFHRSKGTRSSCWIAEWRRWIRRERAPRTAVKAPTATRNPQPYLNTPNHPKNPVSVAVDTALDAAVERSHQAFYDLCRSQGIDPATGLKIGRG